MSFSPQSLANRVRQVPGYFINTLAEQMCLHRQLRHVQERFNVPLLVGNTTDFAAAAAKLRLAKFPQLLEHSILGLPTWESKKKNVSCPWLLQQGHPLLTFLRTSTERLAVDIERVNTITTTSSTTVTANCACPTVRSESPDHDLKLAALEFVVDAFIGGRLQREWWAEVRHREDFRRSIGSNRNLDRLKLPEEKNWMTLIQDKYYDNNYEH